MGIQSKGLTAYTVEPQHAAVLHLPVTPRNTKEPFLIKLLAAIKGLSGRFDDIG
ncbi:MAG: hypothetical protein AAF633_00795 [Chloroflexota bacterium]